jgi:23S rRNA (cytosine1962-C5)-methyltransferase
MTIHSILTIKIRKNKIDAFGRKHPWIFSGAIETDTSAFEDGTIVEVVGPKDEFLAKGHFQAGSIAVRVLTYNDEVIDQKFWNNALKTAVELRKNIGLFSKTNQICRLVHGEGDNLSGLVVDYFNKVAVIQCHSTGMHKNLPEIIVALKKALPKDELIAIYEKSADTLPPRSEAENKFVFGEVPVPHIALENGIKYEIDWINGQKTGFFIDQRESRALLGKYAKGKKVLNTFCYSGGFSLACIQNNAIEVHSLDSSKKAIELTEANVLLNDMAKNHKSIVADAIPYMRDLGEEYDIIVLDPPAFAKHRDKRHAAVQGYKRLNANAIRQIKPGGLIFTFSCSQVVDKMLFTNTIIAAALEAGRNVRIIEQLHQPADHPINAFHPEGEYLKGLVLAVS